VADVQGTENFVLRCASVVLASLACLFVLVLSPNARQASVASGVLACTFAIIGLRREGDPTRRLLLLACACLGVAAAGSGLLLHWPLIARWSSPT
jgi:hypothetical protein